MSYVSFDGSQGMVVVSGYKGVAGDFHRSVSFWLRTTQSGVGTICYWGDDPSAGGLTDGGQTRVRLIEGKVELFGRGSGKKTATSINDGSWHHVACSFQQPVDSVRVRNFADAQMYVDGALDNGEVYEDGVSLINTPEETDLLIGARIPHSGGFTDFYEGDLDEFALYRDVISITTVTGSYNGGTPGADLLSIGQGPALALWYRMGDDPGDSAPNGTLVDQQAYYGRNGTTTAGTSIV